MDLICLRPFDFSADIVFAVNNQANYATAVIRFPAGHECMINLAAACANTKHREKLAYFTFYNMLTAEIRRLKLEHHAMPISTFFPLETDPMSLLLESGAERFSERTYGLNIANRRITSTSTDFKNANFPADSVFEKLKRKHKIVPLAGAPSFTNDDISAAFIQANVQKILRENKKKRKHKVIAIVSLLIGFLLGWLF